MSKNGYKVTLTYKDGTYFVNAGPDSFTTHRRTSAIERFNELVGKEQHIR